VLENDDIRFSAADVLWIHDRCSVPLVFDYQHYWCLNPEGLDLRPTLERFVQSWAEGVRPKIHFSSPRTEMRELKKKVTDKDRELLNAGKELKGQLLGGAPLKPTSRLKTVLVPPIWTGHADFTNPFEFATFMRTAHDLDFDVMLEARPRTSSLRRLKDGPAALCPRRGRAASARPERRPRGHRSRTARRGRGGDEEPDVRGRTSLQRALNSCGRRTASPEL
jgi:UV DNA damage endonuclease